MMMLGSRLAPPARDYRASFNGRRHTVASQPAEHHCGVAYTIYNGPINDDVVHRMTIQIGQILRNKDIERLHIAITTTGGGTSPAFHFYRYLRSLPVQVITHNLGLVNSVGVIVYLAGEERLVSRHSNFHIHGFTRRLEVADYSIAQLQSFLTTTRDDQDQAIAITADRSNLSLDRASNLYETSGTLDASAAVACGLAHRIEEFTIPPVTAFTRLA